MNRRYFGKSLLGVPALLTSPLASPASKEWPSIHHTTLHETIVIVPGITGEVKVLQVSDAHISIQNDEEKSYEIYGTRMHTAFKNVKHYQTGEAGSTTAHFQQLVQLGKDQKVNLLALSGDILNYPSEVSVSFVKDELSRSGLPHMYTAGNHDWHYEGMEGTADELREYWTKKALSPLYTGGVYASSKRLGDINVVMIDNSTYQINEQQLDFFRKEKQKGLPIALIVHIPLYRPGMRMSCGHPDWGWDADRGYEIERRLRWPKTGNSKTTEAFVKEVGESQEVVGVFAGHWHRFHSAASPKGPHQHLALPAFSGQYRMIHFLPQAP
jgi:hypothetical protein